MNAVGLNRRQKDMLHLLKEGPQTQESFSETLGIGRGAISRHLQDLTDAGVIVTEGYPRQYTLNPQTKLEGNVATVLPR